MYRSLCPLVLIAAVSLSCQRDPLEPPESNGSQVPTEDNQAPVAGSLQGTTGLIEGGIAQFWAGSARDPDGDSLTYRWDFGDGASGPNQVSVVHLYVDNGVFTVTLVVSDPDGAADTATATVTILNGPPHITEASLVTDPLPAQVPTNALAHVRFVDGGVLDNPRLTVDWGDGTVSADSIHTYTTPGVYEVSVTVTDKDGAAVTQHIWNPMWVYDPNQNAGTPAGYDLIDLGSLGGDWNMPASLNNRGEIVGSSMTPDDQRRAFLWKDGVMQDIGAQLAGPSSAQTTNDAGWIGGAMTVNVFDNYLVVWRNGSASIFRTGEDENFASAIEVNGAGDVLLNIAGHEFGSSALLRNGELVRLDGFLGGLATSSDMNSRSQIVGYSAVQPTGPQSYAWHAFVWENGTMKDLGDSGLPCLGDPDDRLDCGYSAALAINEAGDIVGAAGAPGATVRAVIWERGSTTPTDLGFGTGRSRALAINDRAQIAGDSDEPGQGYFRDTDGSVVTLGSLGGAGTQVKAMNAAGFVIGSSRTTSGETHPFVWHRSTGMVDLGAGPYGTKDVGALPVAINDRGDIAGYLIPCLRTQSGACRPVGLARAILWRAQNAAVESLGSAVAAVRLRMRLVSLSAVGDRDPE